MTLPAIAYIISAYKYPRQLLRLVSRLQAEQTHFFIHYDKKSSDAEFGQLADGFRGQANVHLLKRHRCDWGGFGHVRATLKGIDEIIRRQTACDYVVLLTGQDYPIKSNTRIRQFFDEQKGKSFMHYYALADKTPQAPDWAVERMMRWHFSIGSKRHGFPAVREFRSPLMRRAHAALRFLSPGERRLPGGLAFYAGHSYWCLSQASVRYIHEFVRGHRELVRFFKYVATPDESFFQTVLLNSSRRAEIVNDDLRHVVWPFVGSPNPAILKTEDLSDLASSPKLFARKFDATEDAEVLDRIDRELLGWR